MTVNARRKHIGIMIILLTRAFENSLHTVNWFLVQENKKHRDAVREST